MSYAIDLDEYTEEQLRAELARRAGLRAEMKCDYCARPLTSTPCKFPERHPAQHQTSHNESARPVRTAPRCAYGFCNSVLPLGWAATYCSSRCALDDA